MSSAASKSGRGTLANSLPVRVVRHALEVVTALVVGFYAAIIAAQVFYRYALNESLVWSEEIVRYGLLWGVMLGAALASDRGAHIALNPLVDVVSPGFRKLLVWITGILVIVFCAVLVWYGIEYCYRVRFMASPAAQFPMMYAYAAIPTGAALIAFFVIVHLVSGTETASSDVPLKV